MALGKQYVDIWKNSNELGKAAGQAALSLCSSPDFSKIAVNVDPSVAPTAGNAPADFTTPGGKTVKSIILQPTPITADKLGDVDGQGLVCHQGPDLQGRHGPAIRALPRASDGLRPLELATPAPRGSPRGAGAFQPKDQEGRR